MMYWLITTLSLLAVVDSTLTSIGHRFGIGQCPVESCAESTYNISCRVRPKSCSNYRYRSYDGSCNNLEHGWWGTPFTPYYRLFKNTYSDGIYAFPKAKDGKDLANPRALSLLFYSIANKNDKTWTLAFMQYGQLVAHDMSLTAGVDQTAEFVACCRSGVYQPIAYTDPRCAPIPIPDVDTFNKRLGKKCMNFYRTLTDKDDKDCNYCTDAKKGSAHPLTGVTGFTDASFVYGSSKNESDKLRAKKGGRLKSVRRHGREYLTQADDLKQCSLTKDTDPCYQAGDVRVNQNPQLAVLQNVFLIYHNYVAGKLAKLNPHWNDEKIYQKTRSIVIGIHQNILYNEILVIMLGTSTQINKGVVYIGVKDFVNDYDPTVNPSVSLEFATGGFRLFHSEIQGYLHVYSEQRFPNGTIRLSDWFDNPGIIEPNFVGLCQGLATQPQSTVDKCYTEEVINYLFKAGKGGIDLTAIDIMRGRDHGLGTYPQALEKCCLGKITTWKDYEKFFLIEDIIKLQTVYSSPQDVELIVGITLEILLPDALTGPVAACIITEQFRRTRQGDRYFFQNNQHPGSFNLEQLREILQVNFGDLLCLVPGVKQMQRRAFEQVSLFNPLLPCSSRKKFNYELWKENRNDCSCRKKG